MSGLALKHSAARPPSGWQTRSRGRWPAFAAIAGLHLLGLYAVLQIGAVRQAVVQAAPLFVSFIAAPPQPKTETPPPPTEAAKPKPQPRLIASPRPGASPMQAPPPLPEPATSAATAPEPPAPPPAPAPVAEPAVIPPNFVAAYLDNPAPQYPPVSKKLQETGRVLLRVLVTAEGRAGEVDIYQSSGFPRLDQAAQEVVRKWRFVPARKGGQPVQAWVQVPINFQLDQ